jgi:hypothetical protein
VANSTSLINAAETTRLDINPLAREAAAADVAHAVLDGSAIEGRRGPDPNAPFAVLENQQGKAFIEGVELDRFELRLPAGVTGYLRTSGGLRPLPIGSRLDGSTGRFTWQAGAGFLGAYDLVFVRQQGPLTTRQEVRILIRPR